jgi:hypothetical protein
VAAIGPWVVPELGPESRLDKLSSKDGEIHLAYAASLVRPRAPGSGLIGRSYEKWARVVDQGLHLHVYVPALAAGAVGDGYDEYHALAARSRFFHIERALPFDHLLTELTKYDWGFHHFSVQDMPIRPGFGYLTNNLYGFVQARLPIITSSASVLSARLVEELGIGFSISDDDMGTLKRRLEDSPRGPLDRALARAQTALGFDRQGLHDLVFGTMSS